MTDKPTPLFVPPTYAPKNPWADGNATAEQLRAMFPGSRVISTKAQDAL